MTDTRLKDILTYGSHEEVLESLREAGAKLSALAVHAQITQVRTEQNFALHNLTNHTAQELLRIAKNYDQGIDIVAWSTRNIFELNLLVRFVLQSESNATRFLVEAAKDEQQVMEGFQSMNAVSSADAVQVINAHVDSLAALAVKHEVNLIKPMTTLCLASIVGCKDEYAAMFKFMSKYVHPSSWLINRSPQVTQSDEYRNILLIKAQLYAGDSYERTRKAFGLPCGA